MISVHNVTQGTNLAQSVRCCRSLWSRTKGLLGTSTLKETEAYWLVPCNSVHTFGMRYPIDVYFLNKKNEVIGIQKNFNPNRLSPLYFNAHSVLELSASDKARCTLGDKLCFKEIIAGQVSDHAEHTKKTFKLARSGGQGTLEFAFIGIFFFAFLFLMMDTIKLCYGWASLQYSVNEAARQNSLGNTSSLLIARNIAKQFVPNVDVYTYKYTGSVGNLTPIEISHLLNGDSSPVKGSGSTNLTGDPSTFVCLLAHSQLRLTPVSDVIWYILGQKPKYRDVWAGAIIRNEPFISA